MTEYEIQPLAWVVKPKGDTVDCEASTTITRTHEGDGQFVELTQFDGKIRITLEEWPSIKQAIETAINEILADELHELKDPTPEPEPTGAELVGKTCWVRDKSTEAWRGPKHICSFEPSSAFPYRGNDTTPGMWAQAKLYREGVEP